MKHLSIKMKLILWYTFFFTLLLIINLIVLYLFAEPLLYDSAQDSIKMTTENMVDRIILIDDTLYYRDNESQLFNYYEDGIAFVLYREESFYAGQYPSNVAESIVINPYVIQRYSTSDSTWLIYDVPFQEGYTLRAFYNYSNVTAAYFRLTNVLILVAPFLILMISLGGYLIVKKALSPVQTIIDSTARIKHHNNYAIRFKNPTNQDELNDLIIVLNDLLDKFEQTIQREQQFSANVSHELRTPVTVLKAQIEYIQTLNHQDDLTEELNDLNIEIDKLERLVQQILELSRTKNVRKLTYSAIHVQPFIESIMKSHQQALKQSSIAYHLDIQLNDPTIISDASLLMRILDNLISNAIKYNKIGGFIHIKVFESDALYTIQIEDAGIGISEDHLDKIFNPFFQAESSRAHTDGSLGIGLSLTKDLVAILKGTIQVKSTLDSGTTFTLNLPKISHI